MVCMRTVVGNTFLIGSYNILLYARRDTECPNIIHILIIRTLLYCIIWNNIYELICKISLSRYLVYD